METNIVGRNLGITDRFREYAEEKSEKVALLADRAQNLEIKLSRHNEKSTGKSGSDRVELTLIGKGPVVRAEADGSDKYAAFDVALGRLLERVRRAKDRRKVHRGNHRPSSVRDGMEDAFSAVGLSVADAAVLDQVRTGSIAIAAEGVAEHENENEDEYTPVVIRKKVFASQPMTVDEALYLMELVGHDFYLFQDSETNRPSVVYRRKGWDYGVIGLEDDPALLQDA